MGQSALKVKAPPQATPTVSHRIIGLCASPMEGKVLLIGKVGTEYEIHLRKLSAKYLLNLLGDYVPCSINPHCQSILLVPILVILPVLVADNQIGRLSPT